MVDGWIAPALTAANPSPIPWTEEELFKYLRTGVSPLHGATDGTMTDVIRGSLALPIVPDSDVRDIAVYFAEMDHASERMGAIEANTRKVFRIPLSAAAKGTTPIRTFTPPHAFPAITMPVQFLFPPGLNFRSTVHLLCPSRRTSFRLC